MDLPPHISCTIEHNPQNSYYQTIDEYCLENKRIYEDIDVEIKQKCIEANSLWVIQFYPISPICFYISIGSSFEEALLKLKLMISEDNS